MLTQEMLKERLDYCPSTGQFTHKTNTTHKRIGDIAGHIHSRGYRHIMVHAKEYKAHRLAFLYMQDNVPEEVDHVNRVRDDNSWSNLRPADRLLNTQNVGVRKDNKHGIRGLSQLSSGRWLHRHQVNKQTIRNNFASKQDAINYIQGIKTC